MSVKCLLRILLEARERVEGGVSHISQGCKLAHQVEQQNYFLLSLLISR